MTTIALIAGATCLTLAILWLIVWWAERDIHRSATSVGGIAVSERTEYFQCEFCGQRGPHNLSGHLCVEGDLHNANQRIAELEAELETSNLKVAMLEAQSIRLRSELKQWIAELKTPKEFG